MSRSLLSNIFRSQSIGFRFPGKWWRAKKYAASRAAIRPYELRNEALPASRNEQTLFEECLDRCAVPFRTGESFSRTLEEARSVTIPIIYHAEDGSSDDRAAVVTFVTTAEASKVTSHVGQAYLLSRPQGLNDDTSIGRHALEQSGRDRKSVV